MLNVNIHQAKTNLSKLIEAALAGKNVIISKAGKPVVKLVTVKQDQIIASYGKYKGKIIMSDDFNEEDPKINKLFYGG